MVLGQDYIRIYNTKGIPFWFVTLHPTWVTQIENLDDSPSTSKYLIIETCHYSTLYNMIKHPSTSKYLILPILLGLTSLILKLPMKWWPPKCCQAALSHGKWRQRVAARDFPWKYCRVAESWWYLRIFAGEYLTRGRLWQGAGPEKWEIDPRMVK